jgi:predicted enzyme related to lactoylglutathione lyase
MISIKGEFLMSNHPIVHIEISANDRKAAGKFYGDVFGWKITDMPEMDYTLFDYEDGRGGGFNTVSDQTPAGTVTVYIQADDIDAMLAKIEAHGGKVLIPKSEIPNTGWFAFFSDPTGNQIALYKSLSQE